MKIFKLFSILMFYSFLFIMISSNGYSQIGIGTASPNPNAVLDLTSKNKAFLMPRLADVSMIVSPVDGMMVYDKSCSCVKVYQGDSWGDFYFSTPLTVFDDFTGTFTGLFTGTYCGSTTLSDATFVVRLSNESLSDPIKFTPQVTDLTFSESGVSDITVSSVSPSVLTTIDPGASLDIIYTLAGSLPASGVLHASFNRENRSLSVAKIITQSVSVQNSLVNEQFGLNADYKFVVLTKFANSIGTATGLPPGVTASFEKNVITIGGIPTTEGTYAYSIPVYGCASTVYAEGKLTVYKCFAKTDIYKISGFLCHNLGADTTLDPHTPVMGLNGAYIQWGKKGPGSNAVVDWVTAPSDGTIGFAAAPKVGNHGQGVIASWNTSNKPLTRSWTSIKTSNDPCPDGYIVPDGTTLRALARFNDLVKIGTWSNSFSNYGAMASFKLDANSDVSLSFPCAGFIDRTSFSLKNRGLESYYTTVTKSSELSTTFSPVEVSLGFQGGKSIYDALPVRCIGQ